MPNCFFVSDLHGQLTRYNRLFELIRAERPAGVFVGGDILPSGFGLGAWGGASDQDFLRDYFSPQLESLRADLGDAYPDIFLIMGNDDPREREDDIRALDAQGLVRYAHNTRCEFGAFVVYGYAYAPPSPFLLKDWERYDVSRGVDPGCVSPEEGRRTVEVEPLDVRYGTIADDLKRLTADMKPRDTIMLFHAPPYDCSLDRAALDGRAVDHVPLDVHVGSIAVQRFIDERHPLLTLHGHIHESTRITRIWKERFGRTWSFGAAHDGPELCLIRFDPDDPSQAARELL